MRRSTPSIQAISDPIKEEFNWRRIMQQISLRKDFLISINMFLILAIVVLKLQTTLIQGQELSTNLKVLYAINAGGYDHIDKNGIHYDADPLTVGTASDYGNHLLLIGRVPEQDDILYRTERYHTSTFGYNIPVSGDGKYALVLKFCEVYFNDANMKVGNARYCHAVIGGEFLNYL